MGVSELRHAACSSQNEAKLEELREALQGMDSPPEIVVGDQGIIEVAR